MNASRSGNRTAGGDDVVDTIPAPLTSSFGVDGSPSVADDTPEDEPRSLGRVLLLAVVLAVIGAYAFMR